MAGFQKGVAGASTSENSGGRAWGGGSSNPKVLLFADRMIQQSIVFFIEQFIVIDARHHIYIYQARIDSVTARDNIIVLRVIVLGSRLC